MLFPVSSDSSRQQKYDVIHRLPPHIPFPPLLDADWSARFFQQETAAFSPTAGAVNRALGTRRPL